MFIKELGFIKGSMETVKGEISAEWRHEGDRFIYTVELPEGVCARFGGEELKMGKNVFYICEGSEEK